MNIEKYRVIAKTEKDFKEINLKKVPTSYEGKLKKDEVNDKLLRENIHEMREYQEKLYAENTKGLLIILQAMDAAGKDSLIKKVMTGINPQGTHVASFKEPTYVDLDHDYLWRINKELPARGEIGIFNRSHYEDVIVSRVHKLVLDQPLPKNLKTDEIWDRRFDEINNFEKYLNDNGIKVIKLFLHVSKEEQKERLMERITKEDKHWKFAKSDITERQYWDDYQEAYEDMFNRTSTEYAPWYILPADRKWFTRYLASEIILDALKKLDPKFPELSKEEEKDLEKWKKILEED
ncbi:polyphosphate kinase 2 family protein [Peptoniphilus sp. MSJ-1]|uniref:Polyphosphate kinase 2 family protein n=1 Tax=Peptoniphilus ovalis TaxID=2841503 RepID=A0ABS6FIN0_9FIRM|nr:polyphosphate kinase 2 family protein [Peptoniphilus ovalis]MBU5670028.1 polyphosphate kinase 2 family protein [Peptoniphilus ovalis]